MKYNPFLPKEKMNLVIIDGRLAKKYFKTFEQLDIKVIPTIPCNEVAEPISYHPDIVMHPINNNTIIVAPNVFEYYREKLCELGIKVIKGEKKLNIQYPEDIAYNVGRIDNFAIHNFKYTDEKLKYYLRKEGLKFVDIKQGYSKCSMAIIANKAIITSDYPIYEKLTKLDIDVLLVESGYINLPGYPYGFIGGTCGSLSQEKIIFSGRFSNHPDHLKIINFLKKYQKNIIYLSEDPLDIGTIISLKCQ